MRDFKDFNVEVKSCELDYSSLSRENYMCPYVETKLSIDGADVSCLYYQEGDAELDMQHNKFGNIIDVVIHDANNKAEIEEFLSYNYSEIGDVIEDSDQYRAAIEKYDAIFEKSMEIKEKLNNEFDFDREEQGSRDYYEDDMIKITETGRDYGVAAIVENLTNDDIVLFVEGDFVLAQIEAGDYAELTIDQYEELKEFIEAEELEVKTAEEMEQEDRDLVSKYRGDER